MMAGSNRRGFWEDTALKTLLCVVVGACAFAASAVAATHAGPAKCINQYQPDQTNAEADACAAAASAGAMVKEPAVPTSDSKALAKAAFTGDYSTVWGYVSPQYQSAVSHSHWLTCQKKNPVAPPGVVVNRIAVATSGNVPMSLPQFGAQKVFEVQMQVLFTRGGSQSAALVYAYWFHNTQNKWVAVWLPSVYSKYKSGGCDPLGPTRGLY
jgi:hypothetical protein